MSDNKKLGDLAQVLVGLNSASDMEQFLESLLTPNEQKDIALRWELVNMLQDGISQREISSRLHISLCKITRGSRELKKEGSIFKRVLGNKNKASA